MSAHALHCQAENLLLSGLFVMCLTAGNMLQESLLQAIDRRMVVAVDMQTDKANAGADGPSLDRASALAGMYNHAGNHQAMPCALGPS